MCTEPWIVCICGNEAATQEDAIQHAMDAHPSTEPRPKTEDR